MQDDNGPWRLNPRYQTRVVERALAGDRGAALLLLDLAVTGLLHNNLDPDVANYIAKALEEVYDALKADDSRPGEVFVRAFKLTRQRGRPSRQATDDRDFDVALWVHLAISECGLSLATAKTRAAELFHVENIGRILKATPIRDVHVENCIQFLAERDRPLPPRQ